ncbi:hypothetical protein J5N97_017552 [Dioscorea zingiberensis]|uniref:Uncharacterized protein n=1 Tax=Dioscorea zingiberensis TaxID=325984 RepID=A0A9D5HGP5_9LILI|nr:hypothetical protein J5N97_017552 [Dioscorea zingiberensis]
MAANEATLDFKPDDEDLMEEDVGAEAEAVPSPKLPSTITADSGEPSNGQRKTKERGLCEETGPRFARRDFDSLDTDGFFAWRSYNRERNQLHSTLYSLSKRNSCDTAQ